MTFNEIIEKIMPEVENGSKEPFMIYRDNKGDWHCDFTQNQYGEKFDWVNDITDPLAVTFTGEDFAKGSYPYVYDKILTERLRSEYEIAPLKDANPNELNALINFIEENMGEFSSEVTDYLALYDKPLAALYEMTSVSLVSDNPDYEYDYDKIGEFVDAVEVKINERMHNLKKQEIPSGLEGSEKSGKRNIEGYEEKICIEIAGKYVVLAENPKAEYPYLVCNIKYDNPLNMEERYNGVGTENYLEAMRELINRVDGFITTLETERSKSGLPFQNLTATEHCIPKSQNADYEGKLIIIKPEMLAPEYRSAEHQLVLCTGGFGASAESSGRAVYVKELHSGKEWRYNRYQVAGLADLQKIPNWAIDKLLEYHKKDELNTEKETAPKNNKTPKDKPTKKPTLEEKLNAAKEKVKEADTQKEKSGEKPKKRDERE
jgi:hypothetical protein